MGTKNCYTGCLPEILNIRNIANDIGNFTEAYVPVNIEEIVKNEPDIIICVTHDAPAKTADIMRKEFAENEIWQKIKAVENKRIYDLDNHLFIVAKNSNISRAVENLVEVIYGNE